MMMQMYFYVGYKATILFSEWTTSSPAAMFGSFIAVALLGIIYEGIKMLRSYLQHTSTRGQSGHAGSSATQYTSLVTHGEEQPLQGRHNPTPRELICSTHHILQTVLHLLQITFGYALMLIAMTFNLWLFLAVVCGLTLGYFVCGWKHQSMNYSDECCA